MRILNKALEQDNDQKKLELQQFFDREKEYEAKIYQLEQQNSEVQKYADSWSEALKTFQDFQKPPENEYNPFQNSDPQITPQNYPELIAKIQNYEKLISTLESERTDSLSEISKMKSALQTLTESVKSNKSTWSENSKNKSSKQISLLNF